MVCVQASKRNDDAGEPELRRYVARPPVANERLSLPVDGRALNALKSRFRDGTRHVATRRGDGILAR